MDEPLFPCTNTLQTPNPPFWTTKTVVRKLPQNGSSTPTRCLDKAVHAQGWGGTYTWKYRPASSLSCNDPPPQTHTHAPAGTSGQRSQVDCIEACHYGDSVLSDQWVNIPLSPTKLPFPNPNSRFPVPWTRSTEAGPAKDMARDTRALTQQPPAVTDKWGACLQHLTALA